MTTLEIVLVAQAVASGMMAGIIWFVQVVHYPLFAAVTGAGDADYARANQARTSLVVLPPMLVEAAAAAWLAAWPPAGIGRGPAVVGLAGMVVVLASDLTSYVTGQVFVVDGGLVM